MSSLKILHNKIWLMLAGLENLSPSDFIIHKALAERSSCKTHLLLTFTSGSIYKRYCRSKHFKLLKKLALNLFVPNGPFL